MNFDFFAEVTHIEKILDHRAHWVVFKLGSYNSKEYAKKLSGFIEENDKYEISLNDGLNFEVENYFDIRKNNWKLDYFTENFKEFYANSLSKNINLYKKSHMRLNISLIYSLIKDKKDN